MKAIWKETKFMGLYASDGGQLRGIYCVIIKGYVNPKGYRTTSYRIGDRIHSIPFHRVICETFHGVKPSLKHHAAHIDGNKLNNRPDNLRWATPKENEADKERHGTKLRGENVSGVRLTASCVKEIRKEYGRGVRDQRDIAKEYGVSQRTIHLIVTGKTWKHV